jgi:predicted Zn-ribbon and HTH transcriptional regulator
MNLKCKRCGYEWDYHGKSKWYVSCPRCKTNIRVRELIEEQKLKGGEKK